MSDQIEPIQRTATKRGRLFRWLLKLSGITALGICCIVWFWRPGTLLKQYNAGHQLGGDLYTDMPGNTCAVFCCAIRDFEKNADYLYSECDLRETKDNQIVIFHDWDIGDLVPDSPENRAALGVSKVTPIPIKDLTLAELKSLKLQGDYEIPSLEDVLQCAVKLKIQKPLILEIKVLHSDKGRNRVIVLAKKYRDEHGIEIHFSAFRRNVSRSFPRVREWLSQFENAGFRVYQVYRPKTKAYDLCESW